MLGYGFALEDYTWSSMTIFPDCMWKSEVRLYNAMKTLKLFIKGLISIFIVLCPSVVNKDELTVLH